MKNFFQDGLRIITLFACFANSLNGSIKQDPLLVCAIMIKNEALVIENTLKPIVDSGIDSFLIFDTGSTDNTLDIVKTFFQAEAITNFVIEQEEFVDFATSRNRALDLVDKHFPQATFIVMPDAEWYLHNGKALLQFCKDIKDDFHASYMIAIQNTTTDFYVRRLIRCHQGVRFVGAVHEELNKPTLAKVPNAIYFEWRPTQKGIEKSIQRWQRDLNLLLKSYANNPFDSRTLFYLGQTYECLEDWENAYIFYKKRIAVPGWDEETFITLLRLGDIAQKISPKDDVSICPIAIQHYLEAFNLRPQRAEPLIKAAQYYLDRNKMNLAYLYALRAVQIPYPVDDVMFIEKYMYDFVRYDILGRCAWYVGEYEIGEWAVLKALEVHPEAMYLIKNLWSYTNCYV